MGTYSKKRYFSSDVYVYEFNPREETVDLDWGTPGKKEKLSTLGKCSPDEEITSKINAGFFGGTYDSIGLYVDEGLFYQISNKQFANAILTKDFKLIYDAAESLDRIAYWQKNAFWAFGTSWTLVIDGKKNYTISTVDMNKFGHAYSRNPRTMIGQKTNGNILFVVVDGRRLTSLGVTASQSADIMISLGCVIAFNNDGGGSSQMIVNGATVNKPSDGSPRNIGSCLYTKRKRPTGVFYTVTASVLNVRKGPGTSYPVVSTYRRSQSVMVVETKAGWARTSDGWCSLSYLQLK